MNNDLKKLSDKASDGQWGVFSGGNTVEIGHAEKLGERPCIVGWPGFDATDKSHNENLANAQFIVALVNAYRAGELVSTRPEVEPKGWVSMKVRQPEDFQAVLCVNSNGWMTVANRFHKTFNGAWGGSHVSAEDGPHDDALVIGEILYWRELPQRPTLPIEAARSPLAPRGEKP